MIKFNRKQRAGQIGGKRLALAVALATGTAVAAVGVAEPAYAKKEKKEAAKSNYSKEFVEAFKPVQDGVAAGGDLAAFKPQAEALLAMAANDDEKMIAGQMAVNIGGQLNDRNLQYLGLTTMLASGKVAAADAGKFNYYAYQLAGEQNKYAEAGKFLQAAIDANYTFTGTLSDGTQRAYNADDLKLMLFENYVNSKDYNGAFAYLDGLIDGQRSAGTQVNQRWIRRGLSVAIENKLNTPMDRYATLYVSEYPGQDAWKDAVATIYNRGGLAPDAVLDLLRLARRTDALQNSMMYGEYIDSADPRKLPYEVVALIDEGYAKGTLDKTDGYISDARTMAQGRVGADKSELASLERDARAGGASLRTVVAAADTFLSYDQYSKAEEFYQRALEMPGADTALVLTRLGIAQAEQGKNDAAKETFAKVAGARQAIARLWAAYAANQTTGG